MNIQKKFYHSIGEFKSVRSLVGMAMLLALGVVVNFCFSIEIAPSLHFTVNFIPNALLGMMYGPFAGALAAGIGDILQFITKPSGAFFFGYTFNAILIGLIDGLFFYKNDVSVPKVIFNRAISNFFINSVLNTLWISMTIGKSMNVLFFPRLLKNLALFPLEAIVLYVVLRMLVRVFSSNRLISNRPL